MDRRKSGVVVSMLFCSLCLPGVEKNSCQSLEIFDPCSKISDPESTSEKTVGVRSFQICHGDQDSLKDFQSNMIYHASSRYSNQVLLQNI